MMARVETLVALRAAQIIGTASLGPGANDPAIALRSFFVDPEVQRCGVGRALLGRLEDRARAQGLLDLPVRSSLAGVPFYRALGFAALHDIWEGDERTVQMRKPLA